MKPGQFNLNDALEKIEELHRRDIEASKAGDYKTLRSLFTPDAVVMPPNGRWIQGADQLDKNFQHTEEAMSTTEILEYHMEFEEVNILGDFAFEWGTISGASRNKDKENEIERSFYKVMRILKKTEGGEWKIHRTIWNSNPPEQSES